MDLEAIRDSLVEMGIPSQSIQESENASVLKGWFSSQKANIIIPASVAETSRDVGLEKTADGKYRIWIYDMDKKRGLGKRILDGELKMRYARCIVMKEVKKSFRRSRIREDQLEDGRIRIRLTL
jgi:hypothetical protein